MNSPQVLPKCLCNYCSVCSIWMPLLNMESDNSDKDSNINHKSFGAESIQSWLTRRSTAKSVVKLLDELEYSGYRWQCTVRGYQQISSITTRQMVVNWILDILGLIIILKAFLSTIITNNFFRLLLGDIFIGLPGHEIQNMLLSMLVLLASGVKHIGFEKERSNGYGILNIYDKLRGTEFQYEELMLTSEDCTQLRKFVYLFSQFYKIDKPTIFIALTAWMISIYLTNPYNRASLFNTIITGLWTGITVIVFFYSVFATVWSFTHNALFIIIVIYALKSVYSYGESILDQDCSEEKINKFLTQQNRVYNFVHQHVVEMGKVTGYGIFVVSCTGNFAMFVSIFIGTGSNLTDNFILVVGCLALGAILTLNTVGAVSANLILSCRLLNYRIARRIRCKIKYKLKQLMVCERLNLTRIGFSTGGIYTLDFESFLLYLLENAGLMLMFITNFNRIK